MCIFWNRAFWVSFCWLRKRWRWTCNRKCQNRLWFGTGNIVNATLNVSGMLLGLVWALPVVPLVHYVCYALGCVLACNFGCHLGSFVVQFAMPFAVWRFFFGMGSSVCFGTMGSQFGVAESGMFWNNGISHLLEGVNHVCFGARGSHIFFGAR